MRRTDSRREGISQRDRRMIYARQGTDQLDLPCDWQDVVPEEELPEFQQVAAISATAGTNRLERLLVHAIRIRRELLERYGPDWHVPQRGGWW